MVDCSTPFLLIPSETLFFRQTFEMKPLKNGIRLTVNGLGLPTPFFGYNPYFLSKGLFHAFWNDFYYFAAKRRVTLYNENDIIKN
jgi:hypothetical protein